MIFIVHPDRSVTSVPESINVGDTAADIIVISPFSVIQCCSLKYLLPNGAEAPPQFLTFQGEGLAMGSGYDGVIYTMKIPSVMTRIPGTVQVSFEFTDTMARTFSSDTAGFTVGGIQSLPFPDSDEQGEDFAEQLKAQKILVDNTADRAEHLLTAFKNVTASAEITDGTQPEVIYSESETEDGKHISFHFKIPRGATGKQGATGPQGKSFEIAKVYPSRVAMINGLDTDCLEDGSFVLIATNNVEDSDNATLWVKNASGYSFLCDMSGATGPQGAQGNSYNLTIEDKNAIVQSVLDALGEASEWLFQDEYLTATPRADLPAPTPGVTYKAFFKTSPESDASYEASGVCDESGVLYLNGYNEHFVVYYPVEGWYYHPVESTSMEGYVSVKAVSEDDGGDAGNDAPFVTLSKEGVASADINEASWHLYNAVTNTLVHSIPARNSPVDFSGFMENGKSYYVLINEISEHPGEEYRSGTITFEKSTPTHTVTLGEDGVARCASVTYEATYYLYELDGGSPTLVAEYPAMGPECDFSSHITFAMGYSYYVVCVIHATDGTSEEVTSETVQFN